MKRPKLRMILKYVSDMHCERIGSVEEPAVEELPVSALVVCDEQDWSLLPKHRAAQIRSRRAHVRRDYSRLGREWPGLRERPRMASDHVRPTITGRVRATVARWPAMNR